MKPVTIALLGDSMTDCWGDTCPELVEALAPRFPNHEFTIQNHAIGSTRAGYGLWRIGNDYEKNGVRRRCLSYDDPDLVLVESFAYNNRGDGPEWIGEYQDVLRQIVAEVRRTTSAKVLLWATIPPDRERLLENVLNFHATSLARRREMADHVMLYLDAAMEVAQQESWPYADVRPAVQKRIEAGATLAHFVNQGDQIHPSRAGYRLCAQVLADAIEEFGLLSRAA